MANKIIPKKSSVAGKQPLTSDLQIGEIAINLADKLIFTKDANGTIVTLGGGGGGTSLPSQTGNTGKFLTTDGTTASWGTIDLSAYLTTSAAASTYQTLSGMSSYLTTSSASSAYQPLDGDLTAIAALAGTSGLLKKTGANTWALDTTTYLDTTTAASTYQTQSGMSSYLTTSAAATTYQPKDADLTAIAALTGTSGFLKTNGSGTWTVDTNTYLTSVTPAGSNTQLQFNNNGALGASANLAWDGSTLRVGSNALLGGTTNPVLGITGAANGYIQSYIFNATNGASSSADFCAYASNGTDAHGWVDMGITGPSYADTVYTVTGPNEAYLFGSALNSSYTGNLVYATDSTGSANYHQWYVGGFTQTKASWKMQLTSTQLQLATSLNFASTGQRITGDFSNATLANRLMFQTSTTNGSTSIFAIPNGTNDTAAWTVFNTADAANAGLAQLRITSGEAAIAVGANGTGTFLPLAFYVNNAKRFQIGTAGQFGIGATPDYGTAGQVLMSGGASAAPTWGTPSASDSTKLPLAGGTMTGSLILNQNLYARVGNAWLSSGGDYMHLATHAWYNGTAWTGDGTAGALIQIGNAQNFNFQKLSASTTPTFTQLFTVDSTGNATATANVTAYSDERKKTNWRDLPANFIEQLAQVKHGIYDRTDENVTQVGVSAQSLRPVMPHAVLEGTDGFLSVAYGNAALTACVALANRVLALEAKIASLVD